MVSRKHVDKVPCVAADPSAVEDTASIPKHYHDQLTLHQTKHYNFRNKSQTNRVNDRVSKSQDAAFPQTKPI